MRKHSSFFVIYNNKLLIINTISCYNALTGAGKDERSMVERKHKLKPKRKWIILGAVVLFVLLIVAALYSGLTLRSYTVESDKVKSGGTVRIVEISDLHSRVFGDSQKPLIEMIKAQKPDLIVLTGDIFDRKASFSGAEMFLDGIKDIAPVYSVPGNHEFWTIKYGDIKKIISGYGITVLSNERKVVTVNGVNLCICGIDDPEAFKYSDYPEVLKYKDEEGILKQFSDLGSDTFNILLAHRPELIDEYRKYDFDLVLAGHTHGGQVRIPFISNGLFAPNQGWFPKYVGGRYDFDNTTMIIGRGLASTEIIPRIFDPPEVVVVDIKSKS